MVRNGLELSNKTLVESVLEEILVRSDPNLSITIAFRRKSATRIGFSSEHVCVIVEATWKYVLTIALRRWSGMGQNYSLTIAARRVREDVKLFTAHNAPLDFRSTRPRRRWTTPARSVRHLITDQNVRKDFKLWTCRRYLRGARGQHAWCAKI